MLSWLVCLFCATALAGNCIAAADVPAWAAWDKFKLTKFLEGEWTSSHLAVRGLDDRRAALDFDSLRTGFVKLSAKGQHAVEGIYHENSTTDAFVLSSVLRFEVDPAVSPSSSVICHGSVRRIVGDYAELSSPLAQSMMAEEDSSNTMQTWFDFVLVPAGAAIAAVEPSMSEAQQSVIFKIVAEDAFTLDLFQGDGRSLESFVFARSTVSPVKPWWASYGTLIVMFVVITASRVMGAKSKAAKRRMQIQQQRALAAAELRRSTTPRGAESSPGNGNSTPPAAEAIAKKVK